MRKLLMVMSILLLAATANAAVPAVVQTVANGAFAGSTVTVNITPTNGNTLIVYASILSSAAIFTSLQDNNSNNFTNDTGSFIALTNAEMAWFRLSNVSGVTSVKITFTLPQNIVLVVFEVSGLATSPVDVMDTTGTNTASSTSWTSHAVTTTNANDIVLGGVTNPNGSRTFAATSPWVFGAQSDPGGSYTAAAAYQVVSSTSTYTPSGTVSPTSVTSGLSASYKGSASVSAKRLRGSVVSR